MISQWYSKVSWKLNKIWPHLWIVLGQTLLGYAIPLEQTVDLAQQCNFFCMEPSSPAPTTSNWRRQPKSDPVKKMSKRNKGMGPKWKRERKNEGYNWKNNRKEDTEEEHQRRGLARPQNMFIESICTNTIYLYTYAHINLCLICPSIEVYICT